jgi:HNH endonuclease
VSSRTTTPAKASAEQRDNFCCVLNGDAAYVITHICPFKEDNFGPRHDFWNILENFWPKETVTAWKAELSPGGISEAGFEGVHNLITLSKAAHVYWNRGAFALKPISMSDNNTTLKVQFFRQKKTKRHSRNNKSLDHTFFHYRP